MKRLKEKVLKVGNKMASRFGSTFTIVSATALLVLGLGFFAFQLIERISAKTFKEALVRQSTVHKAANKIMERDIDDLEVQLQRELGKKSSLVGTFEIYPGKNGLRATHTEAPKSPIEIDTSGKAPFADSLSLEKDVSFFIFTSEGTLVGSMESVPESDHFLFDLSKYARMVKDSSHGYASASHGSLELSHQSPDLRSLLLHPSLNYHIEANAVAKTNLVLVSLIPLRLDRRATATLFLPLFLSILLAGFLALAIHTVNNRRRKAALQWLHESLSGFRYGRIEMKVLPKQLSSWDRSIMAEIQNQLATQSPYSPIYAGRWLEPNARVATWVSFRDTLSLWALKEKVGHDILLGEHWFVSRITVSRPALIHSAVRIFGRAFVQRSFIFNHYSECELLLTARATTFEEMVQLTRAAMRAWTEFESLKANDAQIRSVFVSTELTELKDLFEQLQLGARETGQTLNAALTDPMCEFFDIERPSAPIIELSWMQVLSLPLEKARHLYVIDEGMRLAPQPASYPTPNPFNIKRPPPPKMPRPHLPRPPTIKF